ncbi:MAG: thioredoxin domain-containing protein [Myxococcota bacterium]
MRRIQLALLLLVAPGCNSSSASASNEATPARAAADSEPDQKVAPPTVAAVPGTSAPGSTGSADDACSAAALDLPKSTIIAQVDGEPVRAEAMGDDARDAERDALHTYCREVHRIRQATARRAIDDHLMAKAAREAGIGTEELLRKTLDAVEPPTDEEIEAFYADNKTEQAPPLEAVKGQVAEALLKERSQAAYDAFIGSLRDKAKIELQLPDVRPPAYDLSAAEHSATFGPPDATLTIIEFSDFECPYCSKAAEGVAAVKKRFGDKVRFAYRHFPLSFHPAAQPAAEYSQCANEQDKFWALHDEIFANQRSLGTDALRRMAQDAGLDMTKLDECLASGRATKQVEADMAKGREVGVRGTPSFYFNGRTYEGGTGPAELTAAVEAELRGS